MKPPYRLYIRSTPKDKFLINIYTPKEEEYYLNLPDIKQIQDKLVKKELSTKPLTVNSYVQTRKSKR